MSATAMPNPETEAKRSQLRTLLAQHQDQRKGEGLGARGAMGERIDNAAAVHHRKNVKKLKKPPTVAGSVGLVRNFGGGVLGGRREGSL